MPILESQIETITKFELTNQTEKCRFGGQLPVVQEAKEEIERE
jgi:hypothetical protein